MLRVPIRKDISEYKSKIILNLTGRSLITIAIALSVGILIGAYMWFGWGVDYTVSQFLIVPIVLIIFAFGFLKCSDISLEKYAPLWIQHNLTEDKCIYESALYSQSEYKDISTDQPPKTSKVYNRLRNTKGIEAWSPSEISDNTKEC